MRVEVRSSIFVLLSFLLLALLLYGSPKTVLFSCREHLSADYTIEAVGSKPQKYIERAEYDIEYEVVFGKTEKYRIRHARLRRRLDEKGIVYETGEESSSGVSAEVLQTLEKTPLEVSNGTLLNPEVLLPSSANKNYSVSAVRLSLPHSMPRNAQQKISNATLSFPHGEFTFRIVYRRAGRMEEGERWEVVLDEARFRLKEPYLEVMSASVEDVYLGGWALYDEDGILLACRLQYRITFLLSQTALSPNLAFRSAVSAQVSVERKND